MDAPLRLTAQLHGFIQKHMTSISWWVLRKAFILWIWLSCMRMPWTCFILGGPLGCLSSKMFLWHFQVKKMITVWKLQKYDWRLQSESSRLNALRLNERVSDEECKATRKKTKRMDAEITEMNSKSLLTTLQGAKLKFNWTSNWHD